MKQTEKTGSGFLSYIKGFFSFRDESGAHTASPVDEKPSAYSPERQQEIEMLCNRLFRQKSLVTSGKLQLIGLGKVKKRMGRGWEGLQTLVHQISEEVISRYMAKGDIFLRYQDDKYVIIFGSASCEEGEMKAMLIAEEIKKNIFALNKEELKGFDIEKHVSEVETAALIDKPIHETLEQLVTQPSSVKKQEKTEDFMPVIIRPVEVGTDYAEAPRPVVEQEQWRATKRLDCSYAPLWDAHRNALTTYLCRAPELPADKGKLPDDALDMALLETAIAEVQRMSQEKQKLFIICPVHHKTLYHNSDFKKFTALCQHMTAEQKKLLIFMIVDPLENLSKMSAYWFVSPLKGYCGSVFAEVPMKQKTDFFYLHQCGFDAMGINLGKIDAGEPAKINFMNAFGTQAKSSMISEIFVLDVSTLSLATSAACAGFMYLGGAAIHEDVLVPNKMYRYKYEDLLSGLVSRQ